MAIVYKHIRLDNNEVFYIGIGKTSKRAYEKRKRSDFWNKIATKGYLVDIIYTGLTWEQACNKEVELIKLYGRKNLNTGTLVNLTDGGDGANGYKPTKETVNKIKELNCIRYELIRKEKEIKKQERLRYKELKRNKQLRKSRLIKLKRINRILYINSEQGIQEIRRKKINAMRKYNLTDKGKEALKRHKQTESYKVKHIEGVKRYREKKKQLKDNQ